MRTILCAITICVGFAGEVRGAYLVRAGVSGDSLVQQPDGSFTRPEFADFWNEGAASASASGSSGYGASAAASVNLTSNPGLRLYSQGISGGSVYSSGAIAGAGWEDVIRVSGGAPPATLRIVLQVEGRFALSDGGPGLTAGEARVGVALLPDSSPFGGTAIPEAAAFGNAFPVSEVYAAQQGAPTPDFFLSGDNTNAPTYAARNLRYDPTTGAVTWDVEFALTYSEALGGYGMNLYASARTLGTGGGRATADFGSTIRLTAVTGADGTALSGPVTFDSGFTLSPAGVTPTPAPAGLVLVLSGAMTFGFGAVAQRLRGRRSASITVTP